MTDRIRETILRLGESPRWETMPVAVVFSYGAPTTIFGRLVRQFAGSPIHCMLYLGGEDVAFDASAPRGVMLWPLGKESVMRTMGGRHFIVMTPPEPLPTDVLTGMFMRAMAHRGAKYDYLGAFFYWAPITARNRWTCAEFIADCLAGVVAHILREAGTPRRLEHRLRDSGWTRTLY